MTHDEEIRAHVLKRADELDHAANVIAAGATESIALKIAADLRIRATKLRVQADIRQAVTSG